MRSAALVCLSAVVAGFIAVLVLLEARRGANDVETNARAPSAPDAEAPEPGPALGPVQLVGPVELVGSGVFTMNDLIGRKGQRVAIVSWQRDADGTEMGWTDLVEDATIVAQEIVERPDEKGRKWMKNLITLAVPSEDIAKVEQAKRTREVWIQPWFNSETRQPKATYESMKASLMASGSIPQQPTEQEAAAHVMTITEGRQSRNVVFPKP